MIFPYFFPFETWKRVEKQVTIVETLDKIEPYGIFEKQNKSTC